MELFDGSRLESTDPLAILIADTIEGCIDMVGEKSNLEVELRIGRVMSDHEQRLDLPCSTEVVLNDSSPAFQYRFQPGVSEKKFHSLLKHIPAASNALPKEFQLHQISTVSTMDDFVELSTIQKKNSSIRQTQTIRISYEKKPKLYNEDRSKPLEKIWKDRKGMTTIWTGKSDQDDTFVDNNAKSDQFDFRAAVNIEHDISSLRHLNNNPPTSTRFRDRTSFIGPLWRLDATIVQERGEIKYEVEIEMNSEVIVEEIKKRRNGVLNRSMEYIGFVLNAMRDICCWLNEFNEMDEHGTEAVSKTGRAAPLAKRSAHFVDLRGCVPKRENIEAYKKTISPVFPIIGDYLFRAVAPVLLLSQANPNANIHAGNKEVSTSWVSKEEYVQNKSENINRPAFVEGSLTRLYDNHLAHSK